MPSAEVAAAAALAEVRAFCGWHIAPSKSETVTITARGRRALLLKTLKLTAVEEIRHLPPGGGDPVVLDGYDTYPTEEFTAGILKRQCAWPCTGAIALDITHGHTTMPDEVQAVIDALASTGRAGTAGNGVAQQNAGPFGVRYVQGYEGGLQLLPSEESILNRYRLMPRF